MRDNHPTALDHRNHRAQAYASLGAASPTRSNRLLQISRKLLDFVCVLQKDPTDQDWAALQQNLQQTVKTFVLRATQDDYPAEVVLIIRYILCATLDETLLHHPQLEPQTWQPYCLLDSFPVEHLSQDQFFLALERLCDNPVRYVDALEIIYLCLSLGFEGSYRALPRGQAQLNLHRDKLFHLIQEQKAEVELMLTPQSGSPYRHKPNALPSTFTFGRIGLATLLILAALYGGFSYSYYTAEKNLQHALPAALGSAS